MARSTFRIGVAGFLHESNTFLSRPTGYEAFAENSLTRGEAMRPRWAGAAHELGGMLAAEGAIPLYATFAVPSGTIAAAAYERIASELVDAIDGAGPLDGLLLALHGATVSEEFPDADGEILRRVRALVGEAIPVVITFDLHANLSAAMIARSTAAIGYQTNPHLDQRERGVEAGALLLRTLAGQVRPVQALVAPPLVLRNSRQNTSVAPARQLYDDMRAVRQWPGILSASVAMGFLHADVEEVGASFVAVADGDVALARRAAEWMAERAWAMRAEFDGALTPVSEAVARAGAAERTPVVLMDVGDNVGGGSGAASRVIFDELRRQGVGNALVVLHDEAAVAKCVASGVRNSVAIEGIEGRVRTIADGVFEETAVRHGGWTICDQGVTAVVETAQQHTVVFTSRRMAPFSLEQLISLGIHPERKRALIVKGVIAPRAAYEPVAAEFIMADSPGETADDPRVLPYRRRRRPLYPLEPDAVWP